MLLIWIFRGSVEVASCYVDSCSPSSVVVGFTEGISNRRCGKVEWVHPTIGESTQYVQPMGVLPVMCFAPWGLLSAVFALGTFTAVSTRAEERPARRDEATVAFPVLLTTADVAYPQGGVGAASVVLTVTVNADGSVRTARVAEGEEPFSAAALEAARTWQFQPASRDGGPIAATVRIVVSFAPPTRSSPLPDDGSPPSESLEADVASQLRTLQPGSPQAGESQAETSQAGAAPRQGAMPASSESVQGIVVRGAHTTKEGALTLGRGEVRNLPGAFGDPFRAVDVLPGVSPLISGLPYFYVRGAPPGNTGYFVDGVRVPYLYHFALGPSILQPAAVERVDLHASAHPSRFGGYAGGVVEAELTRPREAAFGEGAFRLLDSGAYVEAPFADGRGSVAVGGRFSYTAAMASALQEEASVAYRDYQLRVTYSPSADDRLTFLTFGAYDYLGLMELNVEKTIFGTEFYRAGVRYEHRLGAGVSSTLETFVGLDRTRVSADRFASDRSLMPRVAIDWSPLDALNVSVGADATIDDYRADPLNRYAYTDAVLEANRLVFDQRVDARGGIYAEAAWRPAPDLEIVPGARLDAYASGSARELAFEPRLRARYQVTDTVRVLGTAALVHQPPAFIVPLPALAIGRLRGGLQKAAQAALGVEADLPGAMVGSITGFRNEFFAMNDAIGARTRSVLDESIIEDPAALEDRSRGWAMGLEFLVRRRLTHRLGFLASYTLSRSVRRTDDGRWMPAAFDRTHVVNAAGSLDLGRGWRAGSKVVFYSGIPRVDSVFDAEWGGTGRTVVRGDRLPSMLRLDVRIEKRWKLGTTTWLALALEALNATGSKDVIGTTCRPVSGCKSNELGFPLPNLALEGGF